MSTETFELMRRWDAKDFSLQLALQCAPLLSGLKCSNLFIISGEALNRLLLFLARTDISAHLLLPDGDRLIFLLYREAELAAYVRRREVADFLCEAGYDALSLREMLDCFARRYRAYKDGRRGFPHELGLFLGYPAEDVRGFIANDGENSLCSGYWKVYVRPTEKKRLFTRFEQEKERLVRLVMQGLRPEEMVSDRGRLNAAALPQAR